MKYMASIILCTSEGSTEGLSLLGARSLGKMIGMGVIEKLERDCDYRVIPQTTLAELVEIEGDTVITIRADIGEYEIVVGKLDEKGDDE